MKLLFVVTRTNDKLTILGTSEAVTKAARKPRDTNRRTLLRGRVAGGEKKEVGL